MKNFRIPRKIKKKLKKDLWFYPMDETTKTYEVVFPYDSQEGYNAWKRGEITSSIQQIKKNNLIK